MRTARPEPSGFAAKAKDLQALRDAVVEASTVSGPLWISYLFVFFYLAIAAGAVTHKDLFFENPVKLPFLNVELPLIAFFVLGPLLFLIVHWYTLLHFALLAGKVGHLHRELEDQVQNEVARDRVRRQLPSNVFVQLLAGPRGVRTGPMGFMLRAIAWISLILGPIALLAFFQLQFLPYHDPAVSWWQRIAVLLDLVLLWVLWPSIAQGRMRYLNWRDLRRAKIAGLGLVSLVPALLVFTVATFPGEWLHESLPTAGEWLDDRVTGLPFVAADWTPYKLLVAGEVDPVVRRPRSFWSNRLVLPGIKLSEQARFDTEPKIAALSTTLSLRGRHLEGAVLSDSDLRKTDFTGSHLGDGVLEEADLREAEFHCAATHSKVAQCAADLRNAQLIGARLQGASLRQARLEGAWLIGTQLQGADLRDADLRRTVLNSANLQGASLDGAQLQDASLIGANLEGTSLDDAHVASASVTGARLDGMSLKNVEGEVQWDVDSSRFKDAAEDRTAEALAETLRVIGCYSEGRPYVVRGLVRQLKNRFILNTDAKAGSWLATAFLDDAKCDGAQGLSGREKEHLREIRGRAPPTATSDAFITPGD